MLPPLSNYSGGGGGGGGGLPPPPSSYAYGSSDSAKTADSENMKNREGQTKAVVVVDS